MHLSLIDLIHWNANLEKCKISFFFECMYNGTGTSTFTSVTLYRPSVNHGR
jgi:hypothetical protein